MYSLLTKRQRESSVALSSDDYTITFWQEWTIRSAVIENQSRPLTIFNCPLFCKVRPKTILLVQLVKKIFVFVAWLVLKRVNAQFYKTLSNR